MPIRKLLRGEGERDGLLLDWNQGDPLETAQFLAVPLHAAFDIVNVELDHPLARALVRVVHINAQDDLAGRLNLPGRDMQMRVLAWYQ